MQKWIILTVVVVLAILTTVIVFNMEIETEYVPEVEASSESLRKTNVSLYFKNKQSNLIDKVNILIDSKKLIKDPYNEILTMLINDHEDENLVSVFPENCIYPEVTFDNGTVKVDFKGDTRLLDDNVNIDEIKKVLNDSLKQFNEVENVILLVNSNEL